MTIKEKKNAIHDECDKRYDGGDNCLGCPLFDFAECCWETDDKAVIERNYDLLFPTEDIDKGCHNCKFTNKEANEEPCINCQNNFVAGTKEYDAHDLLWQPVNSDKAIEMDAVNHPNHYTNGSIECIDAMVAAYGKDRVADYCIINAFKYIWRSEHKNGLEDIKKAIWYLNKHVELKEDIYEEAV